MEKLINELKSCNKRFLVVGDAMLDVYLHGQVSRISPEAPVPVFNYRNSEDVLGGAANVAANVAAMGMSVALLSIVGNDDGGNRLKGLLETRGVDTRLVIGVDGRKTTTKTRLVSGGQQITRIDSEDVCDIDADTAGELAERLDSVIDGFDVVLMSDYQKGLLSDAFTKRVMDIANAHGRKVLVDVKSPDPAKYRGAYLLKPNRRELAYMTDMPVETRDQVVAAMHKLRSEAGCDLVIATLSGDGMMYLDSEGNVYESNVKALQVRDVVGAGDTAFSYIGLGIANGLRPQTVLNLANAASSIKVTKFGTSVVTLDEMMDIYADRPSKILDMASVVERLDRFRERKPSGKVVFTNGCFDILHLGHVRYLKEAKGLGDLLVVGVNSDASVKRLKGEDRPINSQDVRMAMLAELDFIDYIVLFEEDTPYGLIKAVQPDVLVKGGDYTPETIVGHDIVEARGGVVTTIELVDGMSTTNIINAVNARK
jgi:D-beta-D-heptose 7-phosphate kinase/D-beta-D-heptose 1-phosphate adenosyltransferase